MLKVVRNIFILFLAYYIPAEFGFLLALPPDNVTAIWPASGFASAGVVLLGYSGLPGVFLGSLIANLHHKITFTEMLSPIVFDHLSLPSWIALGALLESLLVAFIIKRFIGFPNSFTNWKDIFMLFIVAGILGAIPSPTIGVTTLYFMGYIPLSNYLYNWYSWWIGNSLGIIAIAPILITMSSPNEYISFKRKIYIAIPLITILSIISNIFVNTNKYEQNKLQQSLEYEAKAATSSLNNHINNRLKEIKAIKSFYIASDFVSRNDFNYFIEEFVDSCGSLSFVEWIPKVTDLQKSTIINQAQKEGLTNFSIMEYNSDNIMQKAGDRKLYYPVLYSKLCNETNYDEMGLDILSINLKKDVMLQAINTANITSTPIVLNKYNSKVFTIFQPIYRTGSIINTIEARQKNITGVLSATFKIDDLFARFQETLQQKGIEVIVSDHTDIMLDNSIIFQSFDKEPKFLLKTSLNLIINDRIWDIKFKQSEDYLSKNKEWHLWYMLLAGLIFEALTAILTLIITGYSEETEKLVHKKTTQLKDSEKRFQLAVKGTRVGIWDWADISNENQYWSPEFVRLLGYEPGKLSAKRSTFKAMIHPDDLAFMQKALNQHINNGKAFDIEHRMKTKSGKYRWFQSRGIITEDPKTKVKRMTGSISDIQGHKHTEKTLKKAKEEAESATRMKSEFIATMSHEIRTPMNAIIGITELVLDTKLTDQQKGYLSNVLYSAENLLEILNDILDFSKIEAGKMDLELMPFNLKKAAQEVIDLLLPKAQQKNIQLGLNFEQNTNEYLVGDSIRIRQILHNLVGNSIKFTEKGSVIINISNQPSVVPPEGKAMIIVSVQDTGIGLTKEQRRAIFNKFVQADSTTTRKFGGTGLGLSICQMLVAMFGGEIGVESEPGKGSTFSFSMLLDISTKANIKDKAPKLSLDELSNKLVKSRILMAEDNRINAEFAKEMLEQLKATVIVVRNGKDALELLKTDRNFDLIFMDCQMPIMDGFEATRNVCKYEQENKLKHIPIIALTANAMKGDREKCIEAGMDDYLSKPVRQKDFASKIVHWHNKK